MQKVRLFFLFFGLQLVFVPMLQARPDTVYTGIYVTSIHNIDFRQQEYTIDLWLWLKYKNKDFDFLQNLEVPQAKSVTRSFSTTDSSGGRIYILMKLQCVMKDSWRINRFPFDHQKLRFSIENSQYDCHELVFKADTGGKHYDPRFTLNGWNIEAFTIGGGSRVYETAFGDDTQPQPHSEYSTFNVGMDLGRHAFGLFLKMFLGMYVAFFIALVCLFIHADSIDSRFGLSVGALFAVIGNKYVVDGALPESASFTLVDKLHDLTLVAIFVVIVSTAYSLYLVKKNQIDVADRWDRKAAILLSGVYVAANAFYILQAVSGS